MYCKIFTGQQVYDGMTDMSIACDDVSVTDGWICLYKDEKFVASFDMTTINGWVLIDSTADTPQTDLSTEEFVERMKNLKMEVKQTESTGSPIGDYRDGVGAWQTDCGWK